MVGVDLACIDVTALIVEAPTGVAYSNQAGGLSCNHPTVEGFYVPLRHDEVADELHSVLCSDGWPRDLTEKEVAALSASINDIFPFLRFDPTRKSEEAWVAVIVDTIGIREQFMPWSNLHGMKAYLVYGNCG